MRLLGVVTTYYPNRTEFIRNIKSYYSDLDYLIIWDNTPVDDSFLNDCLKEIQSTQIEIRTTGRNEFLAYPFNQCIEWAISHNFTHLLTMDQDSYFENNQFLLFKNNILKFNDEKVKVFTTEKKENHKKYKETSKEPIEIENAITSGTVYDLNIFCKIGGFREDFLIYMVDIEFCMRVRKNRYKIICFPQIVLNHFTGYSQRNKLGFKIDNYSAQSTYYIIRNVILNWNLYPDKYTKKEKILFFKYKVLYRILKLFFEKQPILKFKAILMAVYHGYKHVSGRYEVA